MTQRRVLKCGIRCKDERKCGELADTGTNQNLDFEASAVRLAAEGSDIVDVDSVWPDNFQISVACVPHLEKVESNFTTENGSQIRRRHERPRCGFVDMENVYVCNVGCSNSSWKGFF